MATPFNFLNTIYAVNQSTRLVDVLKNPESRLEEVLDEDILVQEFRDNKQLVVE